MNSIKKYNRFILTLLSVTFSAFLLLTTSTYATTYYISPSGSDSNTGTSTATPWQSINKVNSANLVAGDTVLFNRGGTYVGKLVVSGSGSSSAPITFSAYGSGANPVLSGGTVLSSWTSSGGGIYEASLATEPQVVTINDTQYAPGRYPDSSWLTMDSVGNTSFSSSGLSGQTGLAGAKAVVRMNRFVMEKVNIDSQSGNTVSISGTGSTPEQGYGFFITNKLSTLTKFGEWFYDKSTHKLKIYTGGTAPTNVVAATTDIVVAIDNHTDISFNNLDFRNANYSLVDLQDTNRIKFDSSTFKYSGVFGIILHATTNKGFSFTNNAMSYINSDGLKIYGGDNTGMLIRSNTFDNMGIFAGEGGANEYRAISFETPNSPGFEVSYNIINNVGYAGINGGSVNSLIKNNIINNFCLLLDDGGAIYVQQPSSTGSRVTGNIITNGALGAEQGTPYPAADGQCMGIYSDGYNGYTEIDNNSVTGANFGMYIDDSHDINVHHNTLFNNQKGMAIDYLGRQSITNIQIKNNIIVNSDTTSTLFAPQNQGSGPSLSTWGVIDNNYYARPLNDTDTIYSSGRKTLAQWKAMYNFDTNSQKSPVALTSSNDIRYEVNNTNSAKTISLGANYVDVKNTLYSGSITLTPFTSAVLLRTSGTPTTDTTAPTISLTAPSNGSTLSGITTISANASDNVGVSKVDFYQGSTLLGSDTTSPYSLSWNTATVSNGSYTLSAKAYDAAGNVGTASGSVSVNNVVTPPPTNTPPTANAGADQTITLPTSSISFIGSGTDTNGSIASYAWTKVSGGNAIVTTPSAASTTVTGLVQGSYVFRLTVTDNQSATGSDDVSVTVNPVITPPTGTFSLGDRVKVVGTRARVRATPSTSGTSLGLQAVGALGTIVSGPTVASGYTWWKVDYDISPDGWSIENRLQKYTVTPPPTGDTIAPVVSISDPINGETISGRTTFITAESDNVGVTHTDLYYGNTLIFADYTVPPAHIEWDTTLVINGSYVVTAKSYDAAGNVGTASVNVVVSNTAAPTNHPPVANAGADQTITLPNSSVTFSGSATDPDNNSMTYAWTKVSGGTATITTPTALSTTVTNLVQGTYTFWLTVTDSVGASNADAVTVVVKAATAGGDTTAPTVAFTYPALNTIVSGTTVAGVYATDNVRVDHVDLYYDNTLILSDHTDPPTYYIEWNTIGVSNGVHTLTIKAYDAAGNIGTATRTTTVNNSITPPAGDITPPTIAILDPVNGETASGKRTFITQESDNIGITHVDLYYGNTLIYSDYTPPPAYIEWDTRTVPNGTYVVTAKAYDAAGNTASASVTVPVLN